MRHQKVLFVCLGNTCRSPMMERMLRHMLADQEQFSHVKVESAGLRESAAGQPMAEFSMKELKNRGINAEGHTSRFIGTVNLNDFDLIVTVGEEEVDQIMGNPDWNPNTPILILGGGVPNPWQQGEEAYRTCASHIEQWLPGVINLLHR